MPAHLIPIQLQAPSPRGACGRQPIDVTLSSGCFSLSLLSFPFSLKFNKIKFKDQKQEHHLICNNLHTSMSKGSLFYDE